MTPRQLGRTLILFGHGILEGLRETLSNLAASFQTGSTLQPQSIQFKTTKGHPLHEYAAVRLHRGPDPPTRRAHHLAQGTPLPLTEAFSRCRFVTHPPLIRNLGFLLSPDTQPEKAGPFAV